MPAPARPLAHDDPDTRSALAACPPAAAVAALAAVDTVAPDVAAVAHTPTYAFRGRELPTRSALRLVLVPTPQPPLDDGHTPVHPLVRGRVSPRPRYRPGPRPAGDLPAAMEDDAEFGPQPTTRSSLPDPHEAGRRLVTAALEVLAGLRPVAQLSGVTTPAVLAALGSGRRPAWCQSSRAPLLVGTVRVCEPVDGVAEVAAVARRAGRAHAVAARLEGVDGRWRCTALQIGR